MGVTSCPLHNDDNEPLRWSFTEPLGTCIYNVNDELSFIIGWMSVISWIFALFPQIITNCRNKSAESQSFWFWMLWLLGDLFNAAGCILTKNLITNICLSIVYTVFTAIACFQFFWFEYWVKKRKFLQTRGSWKQLLSNVHDDRRHQQHKESLLSGVEGESESLLWKTPRFALQFQTDTPSVHAQSMSPGLANTIRLIHRTPRMYSVTPQLTAKMKREYAYIQSQHSQHPGDPSPRGHFITVNRNNDGGGHSDYIPMPPDDGDDPDNDMTDDQRRASRTSTVLGTLSSMTMTATVVTVYKWNDLLNGNQSINSSSRQLLEEGTGNVSGTLLFVGMVMGWCCASIYILSRIPQLKLMLKTKDVSGINPAFFMLTFTGNFCQFLSMMIKKDIYHSKDALLPKLPWICDTGGCILQDGFIICLLILYRNASRSDALLDDLEEQGPLRGSSEEALYAIAGDANITNTKS